MNLALRKLFFNKLDFLKEKKCSFGETISSPVRELAFVCYCQSVRWSWTMKDVSVHGFSYVYVCATWEGPVLTKL